MDKTLERHCLEGCFTFHAILFPIESEIQAGWKLVSARICANIDPCPLLSQAADSSRNLFESPATVFPSVPDDDHATGGAVVELEPGRRPHHRVRHHFPRWRRRRRLVVRGGGEGGRAA